MAGCSMEAARLGRVSAPPEAVAGAGGVGGSAGSGGMPGVGGVGSHAPVAMLDGSIAGAAGEVHDAGEPTNPRPPRPIEGGAVTGSISGGAGPVVLEPTPHGDSHGYVQEELFLEGQATSYAAQGELGLDGVWQTLANGTATYKTRLLVRRPADASAFNGTVVVEWLNTTGGADAAVGFGFMREELLRGGYAYVGVSVQQTGVDALRAADPVRYASLVHPGDAYAYGIYAQAGAAIGWPGAIDPMGGLKVERMIAYGESQSATRMVTYVNAVHPLAHVFDGFFIHCRAGWGAPVGVESDGLLGDGTPVQVRSDSDARVLQFFTESEVILPLGPAHAARQPDSDRLRSWEVAGTAHADQHLLGDGADMGCGLVNDGPQHFVIKAALRSLHLWLKDGTLPPSGVPLEITSSGAGIARDLRGNAIGGIRTPASDVPIATLSGEPATEHAWNPLCMLFGHTVPFTHQELSVLYPTHQHYVDEVTASARASREAGFILPEDEVTIIAEAIAAPIPR
jgi:hypothetical protein